MQRGLEEGEPEGAGKYVEPGHKYGKGLECGCAILVHFSFLLSVALRLQNYAHSTDVLI